MGSLHAQISQSLRLASHWLDLCGCNELSVFALSSRCPARPLVLARHGGSPSDTNGSRPFQFRDTYTKAPQLFQWGLCICISDVVSLPLTEEKGVWGLLGPCLRNWASEIFTGVGKVRGRVLMALDAPVVGE